MIVEATVKHKKYCNPVFSHFRFQETSRNYANRKVRRIYFMHILMGAKAVGAGEFDSEPIGLGLLFEK